MLVILNLASNEFRESQHFHEKNEEYFNFVQAIKKFSGFVKKIAIVENLRYVYFLNHNKFI